ncbi:Intracellular proteinase inhibitor [Evansella caseinilytica]|uniref:Intracellular proteinase inhibitor n=1 Tax=Evansella caseinilytica TaxID=1503961 RepID=A0A1H3PMG6_9BACI|nr:BsuPI-related putative proteinase inhibitor [Evansella caseinilytica]SDZ02208.1 Intracellular proteinase inhibitor [Evansella caseinilytica]
MKKLIFTWLIAVLPLMTAACGTDAVNTEHTDNIDNTGAGELRDNAQEDNGDIEKTEGGEAVMEYDQLVYTLKAEEKDGAIRVTMNLTNEAEETRQLQFSSGQQYDVIMKDATGKVVYHYAEGKMFTQALITEMIRPGETLTFVDDWKANDLQAYGRLTVEAKIIAYELDGQAIDRDKTLKQTVAIVAHK